MYWNVLAFLCWWFDDVADDNWIWTAVWEGIKSYGFHAGRSKRDTEDASAKYWHLDEY